MNKKITIGAILLFVLVISLFFFLKSEKNNNENSITQKNNTEDIEAKRAPREGIQNTIQTPVLIERPAVSIPSFERVLYKNFFYTTSTHFVPKSYDVGYTGFPFLDGRKYDYVTHQYANPVFLNVSFVGLLFVVSIPEMSERECYAFVPSFGQYETRPGGVSQDGVPFKMITIEDSSAGTYHTVTKYAAFIEGECYAIVTDEETHAPTNTTVEVENARRTFRQEVERVVRSVDFQSR